MHTILANAPVKPGQADGAGKPISVATRTSMVAGLKDLSSERWQEFVAVYEPLIRFWMSRETVPPAAEDDVFQNCLISFFGSIRAYERIENHNFRGWLRRIVQRRAADAVREATRRQHEFVTENQAIFDSVVGHKLTVTEVGDESVTDVEGAAAFTANREAALRACELVKRKVKSATWEMFWQSVVEDRPTDEVARSFGVAQANVRVAKMRVLSRLRALAIDEEHLRG